MPPKSQTVAPHGFWGSPITSDLIVAETIGLQALTSIDGTLYWCESRPTEGGRLALMSLDRGHNQPRELIPAPLNVRTRVHEYGGRSYFIDGEHIYFVNFADQRMYRQRHHPHGDADEIAATPITAGGSDGKSSMRYADADFDRPRQRLICVGEDHSTNGQLPKNLLVAIDLSEDSTNSTLDEAPAGTVTPLDTGHDFYASPRISPDHKRLTWLTWDFPQMPWDGTTLWIADIADDGGLHNQRAIAGGTEESVLQPTWSSTGDLYFLSDRSGYWNIYCVAGATGLQAGSPVRAICPRDNDFGQPPWQLGNATFVFADAHTIVCTYSERGVWRLGRIDLPKSPPDDEGQSEAVFRKLPSEYTYFSSLAADADSVYALAGSPSSPAAIVRISLSDGKSETLRRSTTVDFAALAPYLSKPEAIAFPADLGSAESTAQAYAFYYPPTNPDYCAPEGEKAPLIVTCHGGPTSAASNVINLGKLYWTSRGIAVVDVNYSGSSGYGRAYRNRLQKNWGIADVDDCIAASEYLAKRGDTDRKRVAISGGSAGGYTVLRALTDRDYFCTGASYYGVSDLELLHQHTHKFESQYVPFLVGPYPQEIAEYQNRSPIQHVSGLSAPVVFFQGSEDKVVPPEQAERMVAALRSKNIPVAHYVFEGEQHGFRIAANIKTALDAQLAFFAMWLTRTGLRFPPPSQAKFVPKPVPVSATPAAQTQRTKRS